MLHNALVYIVRKYHGECANLFACALARTSARARSGVSAQACESVRMYEARLVYVRSPCEISRSWESDVQARRYFSFHL